MDMLQYRLNIFKSCSIRLTTSHTYIYHIFIWPCLSVGFKVSEIDRPTPFEKISSRFVDSDINKEAKIKHLHTRSHLKYGFKLYANYESFKNNGYSHGESH